MYLRGVVGVGGGISENGQLILPSLWRKLSPGGGKRYYWVPISPSIIVSTISLKILFHCEAAMNGDFGFIWLASFYNAAPYFIAGGVRPKSAT